MEDQDATAETAPLQPASQDRVNIQRESILLTFAGASDARDSSVHDKIHQFNSLTMQSKQLERKTADAALKRAMLGREEAEAEMRRYRDEARALRRQVEEGRERERRVGERLETVMENYGRAKETHAHTQALWEKEIRRARKETFKLQSAVVKLQEELKTARAAQKSAEEALEGEKLRSETREQEAFSARYSLVGVQQQLDQALERIKVVEQERDAFKTLAASEEDVARIAAEGKLPLPSSADHGEEDEFASPRKKRARISSLSVADIKMSASTEAELDEMTLLWQWEKQRADRALDHVEYLEVECEMRACPCTQHRPRSGSAGSKRKRSELVELVDAADHAILGEKKPLDASASPTLLATHVEESKPHARQSTIFDPTEGVFRTVPAEDTEAVEAPAPAEPTSSETLLAPSEDQNSRLYARTPSVEPPDFALLAKERESLASLLEAPHQQEPVPMFTIPTTPGPAPPQGIRAVQEAGGYAAPHIASYGEEELNSRDVHSALASEDDQAVAPREVGLPYEDRPHTVAAFYHEATTTTKVPLRDENADPSLAKRVLALQKTPTKGQDQPSFDHNNPALTPTMTREQALAQIRERRGRARSVAQGVATPKKQMVQGAERRDVSAPAGRAAGKAAS